MREFKFRAYHKKHRKMIEDDSEWFVSDLNKENGRWTKAMQCTGLKDKNGKEIYEGDIISSGNKSGGTAPNIDVIQFIKGRFVVHDQENTLDDMWIGDEDLEEIEVIGNIYENPDLVNKR